LQRFAKPTCPVCTRRFSRVFRNLRCSKLHGDNLICSQPLIFLINNGGYTIERTILGLHAKYNDVANWHYADLPRVFSRREVASHVVATSKELSEVLRTVDDSFVFVELLMKPNDAPLGLIRGGHASANLDYGPRGPPIRCWSTNPGSKVVKSAHVEVKSI
jgi:hypothetical protein